MENAELIKTLTREMPAPLPLEEAKKLSITDIRKGGYIRIGDATYFVQAFHRYGEGKNRDKDVWWELQLISLVDGETTYLEWEIDDEVEVYHGSKIAFRALGLSDDDLEAFDDDERESFTYEGVTYYYDDSGEARFYKDDGDEAQVYYYWDFFNRDETICVGVETWDVEDWGDMEASISRKVNARNITFLVKGGE